MGVSQTVAPPTPSQDFTSQNMDTIDYDSLSSPVVNKTPFVKFAEQTPLGSQAQIKTKATALQAQPMTSTPAKPATPQVKPPVQTKLQAQAQAQMRPPAPAQPVRPAPAYFHQPQAAPPQGLDACLQDLLMRIDSQIFQRAELSKPSQSYWTGW